MTHLHSHVADVVRPSLALPAPPSALSNVTAVALRELRDATRSRWFLLDTLAFLALGLGVSYISAVSAGGAGLAGFGRTTAGLLNLVLLIVPLMALTAGAGSIASDRERGMLPYLLAQPIARWELLVGKYVGLAMALLACIALGLGSCAAVLAWKGEATDPASIVWLAVLSFALALTMLSVGMLVSVLARKTSVAVGTAVFLWLAFVFVTDLGLMAGTLAFRLRIETLFACCVANPLQVFKMWSLHAIDTSLDVLGPAGLYGMDTFGDKIGLLFGGVLAAWIIVPLGLAVVAFARRSPI
jgi:Cu-processing system permease protein